jgi:hypothetical protein
MGVSYPALKGYQMSHRFSPYSSRYKPFASSHCMDSAVYGGLPNFDPYQASATICSWTRPAYPPQYGLAYSDESTSHYSTQPPTPSYMLPNTDPINNTNSCYSNSSLSRVPQASMWNDPVSSATVASAMTGSSGCHLNTAYGLQDNISSFHTVCTSPTDRILPTPSASRNLAAAPQSSLDSQCLSALSHHSSSSWNTDTLSGAAGASSRTSTSTDSESRMASADPFGYIDVSSNAQDAAESTTGIEISHSSSGNRRLSEDGCPQMGSRDNNGMDHLPTDTMSYPYTSSRTLRNHQPVSGRLISGQLYQPIPNSFSTRGSTQQDCSPNLQNMNHESTWQSQNHSQRSSVASLSNSSSFSNIH